MSDFNDIIARIEDLPYYTSPPAQFFLTERANLALGVYVFGGLRLIMTGNKNITDNTLIYIRSLSFSADIPAVDYQQALQLAAGGVDIPTFRAFLQSGSSAPIFEDPIVLNNYFDEIDYRLLLLPKQIPNRLTGFFTGTLQQTAALAGYAGINFTLQMWAQVITDDNFIAGLKRDYPRIIRS